MVSHEDYTLCTYFSGRLLNSFLFVFEVTIVLEKIPFHNNINLAFL